MQLVEASKYSKCECGHILNLITVLDLDWQPLLYIFECPDCHRIYKGIEDGKKVNRFSK